MSGGGSTILGGLCGAGNGVDFSGGDNGVAARGRDVVLFGAGLLAQPAKSALAPSASEC